MATTVIIGAGMAGLSAAQALNRAGHRVIVLEKSWGVGGRCATRRFADGVFDHGAQFFTVRDGAFGEMAAGWTRNGIAIEWCRGFPDRDRAVDNGHPRYCGARGMTSMAKNMTEGLDVRLQTLVRRVARRDGRWEIVTEDESISADALLLTPPVPQSLALVKECEGDALADARTRLGSVRYEPCFAILAQLEGPSGLPAPGAVRVDDGTLAWIADNSAKGISPIPGSITLHADNAFSRTFFDANPAEVGQALIAQAKSMLDAPIRDWVIHRWRYSIPTDVFQERFLLVQDGPPLAFAGDAFAGPRIEGAVLSGTHAAAALANALESA